MYENMAALIAEQRKKLNMTQKQLAEKIGVTDKAVSKWERGAGYPDIATLPALAQSLHISVGKLLGEDQIDALPQGQKIVENTLNYADTSTKFNLNAARRVTRNIITFVALLAIVVCAICNMAIQGRLTWSLYPITSIFYAWAIIIPLFHFQRRGLLVSLAAISLLTLPYLYIIGALSNCQEAMQFIGMRIAFIVIIFLWIILLLFTRRNNKFLAGSITALLAIPVTWAVNYTVDSYLGLAGLDVWDIVTYTALAFIALLLFFLSSIKAN